MIAVREVARHNPHDAKQKIIFLLKLRLQPRIQWFGEKVAGMVRIGRDQGLLGISVGEHALLVAEVTHHHDSGPVARIAEFPYPADITIDNGNALGGALAHFLQWHGFAARRVVFGVPAKWLISKPYLMPPADAATTAGVLWLHSTEVIPAELGEMVLDYAGESSPTESSNLLLVGLQKQWMDRLLAIAKGARLKTIAVTPSGAAIGAATAPHVNPSMILSLQLGNAELIVQHGRETRSIRHIASAVNLPTIVTELRRAATTASSEGFNLAIWNDAGFDAAFLDTIRAAVNLPVVEAKPQWMDVSGEVNSGLTAVALTLAERNGERPSIDFRHPRLTPPKERRVRKPAFWITSAAAAVVLAVIGGFADIANLQAQVSNADSQLQLLRPAVETARKFVANTQFAALFQPKSPRCLACIRDLTLAVDDDGKTYFISLNVHTESRVAASIGAAPKIELTGEIIGRAATGQDVLNLMDRLSAQGGTSAAGGQFKDLNCKLDPPGRGRSANEVSFILTFSYIPQL